MIKELSEISKELISEKLIYCNEVCRCLIEIYTSDIDEFWKNKASFFSLFYILATEKNILNKKGVAQIKDSLTDFQESGSSDWNQYYVASSQGVNDKKVRETRNDILKKVLC